MVFGQLADLPPAPLGRDLRLGVMAAVRAQQPARLRPIADPQRPAVQLVFGLQVLAAIALLVFAWPFVANLAHPQQWIGAGVSGPGMLASTLTQDWIGFSGLWPAVQHWLAIAVNQPAAPLAAVLSPAAAGLVLAAAGIFWLLGNALLLRPGAALRFRRHS